MEDEDLELLAKKHGLTVNEIKRLRRQAETPWMGATIASLKFDALLEKAKRKFVGDESE